MAEEGGRWDFANIPSSSSGEPAQTDGFTWFRAWVHIPADWEGSRLLLIAGEVSEVDEAFFNGHKVGANGAMPPLFNTPASSVRRPFVIEPDWIAFGDDNLIAWRVYSRKGKPTGILSGPVHLTRTDDAIDLSGRWWVRQGDSLDWADLDPADAGTSATTFREQAGSEFAGHRGVIPADKNHREKMIAAVYGKFEGNPNPYAASDDKGEPLDAEASKATFNVQDGLAVDTVLEEPTITQPLYVDFDERGRMWVVQYIQYPNPAGLDVLTWDNHLRKVFDKVPPPPPYDTPENSAFRGRDRITIHEDTNGDGRFDSHKTFLEGLNLATSVARGRGGVWVMQPPYLLFYPDKDGDDIPDEDPVVHLSGFGLEDTHSIANSLKWGPDGWLYGGVGSTVTARVRVHLSGSDQRHTFFGQNIWRYQPEKHVFELFAEGGWNTFGVDFDDKGRVYSGTNGTMQAVHFVQGGYYQKSFGKHGPHTNPYAFGHFYGIPISGEKVRLVHQWIYYASGAIPPLEGTLVGGNSLASKLHTLNMEPTGSSFKTIEAPNPISTDHKWFRPVHCTAGPDGAIYVSDFYDARITHVDPRDNWDRERGRIYRLRAADASVRTVPNLAALTGRELVDHLSSPNQWVRRTAQRLLADRRDDSVIPVLLERLESGDAQLSLEALWGIHASGGWSHEVAVHAMQHGNEHVRSWAVRLTGDRKATLLPDVFDQILSLASNERSPVVVSQLASTAGRLPSPQALPVIEKLTARDTFEDDAFIPQQLWWALEIQLTLDPLRTFSFIGKPEFWQSRIVRGHLAERIARRLLSERNERNLTACANLLILASESEETASALVKGMNLALEGNPLNDVPSGLDEAIAALWRRYPNNDAMIQFALRLGSASALRTARDIVTDSSASDELRIRFIESLSDLKDGMLPDVLLKIMADSDASADLRLSALNGLRRYTRPAIAESLLGMYSGLTENLQKTTQIVLASRQDWSLQMLQAVAVGSIPRERISFDLLLSMQNQGNPEITALITKHWGALRQSPEEKGIRIKEVREILDGDKGNAERGRGLFATSCGICHKLNGIGRDIAPDLSGYELDNLDFLLPAIVDPNLGVREEFELVTVALKSTGDELPTVLSGFVTDRSSSTVTITDLAGNETVVGIPDIATETRAPVSVMPDGLLDTLTDTQIRDLFAFLQSKADE